MYSITVFFHYTRCGSTVLTNALGQHSDIMSLGEILNPDTVFGKILEASKLDAQASTTPTVLTEMLDQLATTCSKHIVFEVTAFDLYKDRLGSTLPELFYSLAARRKLHVVHLVRLNLIERLLSTWVAEASKVWHVTNSSTEALHKVTLDVDKIKLKEAVYSDALAISRFRYALSPFDPINLEYEVDVMKDVTIGANKVFDRLGLTPIPISPEFRKLPRHEDRIENWSEIKGLISDSGFGFFLSPQA